MGAVDYKEVQEKVEREWKNVMVTDRMDKASLQKSITDISEAHQKMTEVGLFTSGTSPEALTSQEKLMRDVKKGEGGKSVAFVVEYEGIRGF